MKKEDLEKVLSDIISTVGIPANIRGYKFLREAIKSVVKNQLLATAITKKLYPQVAEEFQTTSSKVERAIRHAIDVGYNAGKMTNINNIFGINILEKYERPSNGQFIAIVAERLVLNGYWLCYVL